MFDGAERFLLADLGGTRLRLALGDRLAACPLRTETIRVYSLDRPSELGGAIAAWMRETGFRPRHALLAIAALADGERLRMSNRDWCVEPARLRAECDFDSLRWVNDFVAAASALPLLDAADLQLLGSVPPAAIVAGRAQCMLAVGVGTGLGVAALRWRDGRAEAIGSEGGHLGFAPRMREEIAILEHLAVRFGRVSNERLLSGPGLLNLYAALAGFEGRAAPPQSPEELLARARGGRDPDCARTVEVFCALLGAVAGDLVLAHGAWDGVYLSGGLARALLPWLLRGEFRRRFEDKGRYAWRLARVPSLLVRHPEPGLLGAAALAVGRHVWTAVD